MTEDEMGQASIEAMIAELQKIIGTPISPLGQPYNLMNQMPAPPGYRLNMAPELGALIKGAG